MKKQIMIAMALAAAVTMFHPSIQAEAKWKADSYGRWYTVSSAPGYMVGWKKIGKYTYYFNKNKYAATGWKLISKNGTILTPKAVCLPIAGLMAIT